jgi:predicted lipoprotein
MSTPTDAGPKKRLPIKRLIALALALVLVVLMFTNTRFLSADESSAAAGEQFSAEEYAEENYETAIAGWIQENAVPAEELHAAMTEDLDAAGEQYGNRAGASAWAFPVTLSGVAGEVNPTNGQLPVTVEGLPEDLTVIVQMGPPVNGSALRDVTGEIEFGMFTNQIEYQSVAVQLNNKVKELVLADLDAEALNGQTINVTGAFSAGNPEAWIVTPVEIATALETGAEE